MTVTAHGVFIAGFAGCGGCWPKQTGPAARIDITALEILIDICIWLLPQSNLESGANDAARLRLCVRVKNRLCPQANRGHYHLALGARSSHQQHSRGAGSGVRLSADRNCIVQNRAPLISHRPIIPLPFASLAYRSARSHSLRDHGRSFAIWLGRGRRVAPVISDWEAGKRLCGRVVPYKLLANQERACE